MKDDDSAITAEFRVLRNHCRVCGAPCDDNRSTNPRYRDLCRAHLQQQLEIDRRYLAQVEARDRANVTQLKSMAGCLLICVALIALIAFASWLLSGFHFHLDVGR